MLNKYPTCPYCGGYIRIGICDDEGNIRNEEYESDPWSGLGYVLLHEQRDSPDGKDCPIATQDNDGEILGIRIYDTRENANAAATLRTVIGSQSHTTMEAD